MESELSKRPPLEEIIEGIRTPWPGRELAQYALELEKRAQDFIETVGYFNKYPNSKVSMAKFELALAALREILSKGVMK